MTLSDRVRITLQGMLRHTIWAKGAVDHIPPRYRSFVRFVFPIVYLTNVVVYGIIGTGTGGSMILQQALPRPWSNWLCFVIGAAALLSLCGVVFGGGSRTPVGQQLERLGDFLIIIPTLLYFIFLCAALGAGASAPLAALQGTTIVTMFALFRAFDLSREIGKRDAKRKAL